MSKYKRGLVSISIISYNYGRYLSEAIESVLGQIYKPIEVVVVDDGSKDNTSGIAKKYDVKLIRQKNMGPCYAFNKGVQSGSGEYSLIVSADDKITPTCVREMVKTLEKDKRSSFVYSSIKFFGGRSDTFKAREFNVTHLFQENYINGTSLMRRLDFDAVGGFDLDYNKLGYEDWDLWLKFASLGKNGVYIPKPLVLVRYHRKGSRNRLSESRKTMITNLMKKKYPLPHKLLEEVASINKENMVLSDKVRFLEKSNHQYRAALDYIYNSRSWKLVKKLKKIKGFTPFIKKL